MKRYYESYEPTVFGYTDITQNVLLPLETSLNDPGSQISDRREENRPYDWSWTSQILPNGDIIVTLFERDHLNKKEFNYKEFPFSFEEIRESLDNLEVNPFSMPTLLGKYSRRCEDIMKKIDKEIRREAFYIGKNETPQGVLVVTDADSSEVYPRYEKAIKAVAKWHAIWSAINCHGNYEKPYGGRVYNLGRVLSPTYFEAHPPV